MLMAKGWSHHLAGDTFRLLPPCLSLNCDQMVYGPPLNSHCTVLSGSASVRISTAGRP